MVSPVRSLEVIAFLDLLAAGLIVPQLAPQARSLGCNHILIGLMGSIYSACQLVSSPMTGSLSDIKGRLEVLLISITLSGVAYTLIGVTNSILLFIVLRAVLGITKHTQLLVNALSPDYVKDKDQLSKLYGRLSTLKQAGMCLGPIIGGHIVEWFPQNGFTIIAFVVGAIFAFNSGLIRRLPKVETSDKKKEQNKPITPTLMKTVATTVNQSVELFYKVDWKKYIDVFSFKLFRNLCIGVYVANYALYLKTEYGVSSVTTGYMIGLFSAVGSLTSFFIGYVDKYYEKDKDYTQRNFHVFVLMTLSLVGVAHAPSIFVYVIFVIPLGIASSLGNLVINQVILCKTDSDSRGTVLGVAGNLRSMAGVVSPLISGIVGQFVGVLYVVYVSILFAAYGTYKSYIIRANSLEEAKKK